jgi:uncharacterized protein YjiS (DUF1127 family)
MTLLPFTATPPAIPARWTASRYNPSTSISQVFTLGLKTVMNLLVEAQDRARRNHALANLDDRLLSDVGLTRGDANAAAHWHIR